MNITFLIGNGFDLNLGLKTKYTDFLEHYLKDDKNDNDTIKQFKKDIEKNLSTWADAELAFGKYTDNFKEGQDELFIDCWEDFCQKLNDYLKNEQSKINYSLEETKTKINNSLSSIFYNLDYFLSKNIIINSKFKNLFDYLYLIQKASNTYDKDFLASIIFNFINFNYTNTLLNILSNFDNDNDNIIVDIFNIHNRIDKSIILGVSDETQISNIKLFENNNNKKFIIKSLYDNHLEDLLYNDFSNYIEKSDIIIIYGLSLGETDKHLWSEIINSLYNNPDKEVLLYAFNNNITYARRNSDIVKNKFKDKFLSFASSDIDVDLIKNRIYCIDNNIFGDIKNLVN